MSPEAAKASPANVAQARPTAPRRPHTRAAAASETHNTITMRACTSPTPKTLNATASSTLNGTLTR